MQDNSSKGTAVNIPWGEIGYATYKRTYARRYNEDDKSSDTEEFSETIDRVINACRDQLKVGFTPEEEEAARRYMLQLKGIVAGRFLWQLGTRTVGALGLASLQNCAVTLVDDPIRPFTWAFDMLMLGSGVGYNIQREYVYKIPPVIDNGVKVVRKDTKDADFIVPDSREGWVNLLEKTLEAYFKTGKSFSYSTVCIRGKGTPIKGFGGTASGPEDLCWGIERITELLDKRAGKQIRPIDCLDIMNIIGYIVVSGNVRRSAQIAIGDIDDRQFLNAKRWDLGNIPNWRAMSNNSVVCNDYALLPAEFWQGYEGNGEPYGLINLKLAREVGRLKDGKKYKDKKIVGFNPCFTGDTLVAVADGRNAVPIKQLAEENWTGPVYTSFNGTTIVGQCSKVWKTRENADLVKITLDDGSSFRCTPDHLIMTRVGQYCAAKDLEIGMSLMPFNSYQKKDKPYRMISSNTGRDFGQYRHVAQYYDIKKTGANLQDWHHVDGDGSNDCPSNLSVIDRSQHISEHKTGLNNAVFKISDVDQWKARLREAGKGARNPNSNGLTSEEMYDRIISATIAAGRRLKYSEICEAAEVGQLSRGRLQDMGADNVTELSKKVWVEKNHKVVSVEFLSEKEDVYDLTVDVTHNFAIITSGCDSKYVTSSGVFVHNCAEQSLEDKETCCLAEIYLPNVSSKEELKDVAKTLYRIAKHSLALDCHHADTATVVHRNMRMGIGVTGYLQATEEQRGWLSDTYEFLREFDVEYSAKHGWPKSIKLTTTKPSGTLSLLAGVTSGVHPAIFQYFIRRIRMASDSPLIQIARENGYKVEYQRNFDGTDDKNTMIVEFPCSYPEGTVLAKDTTAVDQLNWVKRLQTEWSDNAVSCTVYYRREELPAIKAWLAENFNTCTKTVSFLLHNDHGFDQAPFEEITKEQYLELKGKVKPIVSINKQIDMIDSLECQTGACPVR